jgi:hypothetical protein
MTMTSERHSLPWFAAMSGAATLVASAISTQFLLATSPRLDAHTWTITTQASLQIALALAVFSVAGTVIGWYSGARSSTITDRTAAVLIGVASALFVVVAGIVTAAALMPDVVMVLLAVPIPASVGGAAAGASLWRSRQPRSRELAADLVLQVAGTGARPRAMRAVRVAAVPEVATVTAIRAGAPSFDAGALHGRDALDVRRIARGGADVAASGAAVAAIAPVDDPGASGL